jgi:hypothetical protein
MTIRREDLVAAAALGLLQYRQIDPLLVFLLQRDVVAQRLALAAQVRQAEPGALYSVLTHLVVFLALLTSGLFAVLFTTRAVQALGIGALFFFTLLYGFGALGLSMWFKRRGYYGRLRLGVALTMASVPLAVFALHQVTS